MFQHQGIWLPDGEKHFPDWMTRNGEIVNGKGTYQIKKLREALKHVRQWRRAIDVGGHVGLWSMHLAGRFTRLDAFEPMSQFRECFMKNIPRAVSVDESLNLHSCALGSTLGQVRMVYNPKDSGGTHVGAQGDAVEMRTLDSFLFPDVDFIKIDCEGFELEVLKGAWRTISLSLPTIIVEQKPHKLQANYGTKGAPAVDYLKELGYRVAREMSGDYIMVPPQ
jgi:FkbM family methyltransferase